MPLSLAMEQLLDLLAQLRLIATRAHLARLHCGSETSAWRSCFSSTLISLEENVLKHLLWPSGEPNTATFFVFLLG